jgi:hypothetical protein
MDVTIYVADMGRVASLLWSDCEADLQPRPDADFYGRCESDIYVDLLVMP